MTKDTETEGTGVNDEDLTSKSTAVLTTRREMGKG